MSYSRMSCGMFHQHVDGQKTIWPPKPHQHCTTQKIIPCICHACQQLGTQSYHLQVGDSLRPGLLNPSPFHVNSLELHDALPSASQQRTLWPWRASHYQGFAMLVTWVVFSAVLCARAAICVLGCHPRAGEGPCGHASCVRPLRVPHPQRHKRCASHAHCTQGGGVSCVPGQAGGATQGARLITKVPAWGSREQYRRGALNVFNHFGIHCMKAERLPGCAAAMKVQLPEVPGRPTARF
eukprot:scaffold209492_cov19-Tisochrysis_lutea.AAC.1